MREKTKQIKEEMQRDIFRMDSKKSKTEDGRNDRKKKKKKKWEAIKAAAETAAQKQYSDNVLTRIKNIK